MRAIFSIILDDFSKTEVFKDVIKISVPVLSKYLGLVTSPNKRDIWRLQDKIKSFHNIVGLVHNKKYGLPSVYPVLLFMKYEADTNSISFSSPYLNYIIKKIYEGSLIWKKNGDPELIKGTEKQKTKPTYSYLTDNSINIEKNKAAANFVDEIVKVIEQAGSNTPKIRASTLIERNVQFAARLTKSANPNQLLARTFKRVWELLRTKTHLTEVYKNIQLPDPNDPAFIPTMKSLNMVFSFPHEGKIKK